MAVAAEEETKGSSVVLTQVLIILLRVIFVFGRVMRYALLMVMLIAVTGYGLTYLKNADSFRAAQPMLFYDKQLYLAIKLVLPDSISYVKGIDIARLYIFIAAYIIRMVFGTISWRCLSFAQYFSLKDTVEEMHAVGGTGGDSGAISAQLESLKQGGGEGGQSREELLKMMGQVQRNLDAMKRNLAFLSIDVVDSTGMKTGEDSTKFELDIMEYNKLVEKAFGANGYLKAAWTPDGVMSCFKTSNSAVKAAMQIMKELDNFNKNIKTIGRDFIIRCGINAGKVAYDEKTPMEQMADQAIDLAGHFQKYAPIGTITISKVVYDDIVDKSKFKLHDQKIDNLDAYVTKLKE